jgi:amino acid transporter
MSNTPDLLSEKGAMKENVEQGAELSRSESLAPGESGPETSTKRGLKSRHAQMIALGGTIGTGLFVGAGQGLKMGGPLFLLLAYIIITLLLYGVATAT